MKIVEKLSDMMEEEMFDSERYIECAMRYKEDDAILAKMFFDLSLDELKHANMLHENATRIINEYKQQGEEVPMNMQSIYNYLHDRHIERMNEIKLKQAIFR